MERGAATEGWPRSLRALRGMLVDAASGRLSLWAMSLVYTTLLSLVPLLAVCFSVLKGFGVHQQIEPVLAGFLQPLGERGEQITRRVIEFVENVQVGVLGSAGLAFLFYNVLSLIQKVERAFNAIWQAAEPRPLGQRLSSYLSAVLVGPVLVVSILGMTASAASSDLVQWLLDATGLGLVVGLSFRVLPYALVIAGFTFVYKWIPNAHVRLGSAFFAALVAGLTWETAGLGFASFVAGSGRYAAVYSGFAILLLFLIWTYLSWLILLGGASLAFHHQHPDRAQGASTGDAWGIVQDGLRAAERIVTRFEEGGPQETEDDLARGLGLSRARLARALEPLLAAGWLVRTDAEPARVLPARAPGQIPVAALVESLRSGSRPERAAPSGSRADELLARADRAIDRVLEGRTLADLSGARAGSDADASPGAAADPSADASPDAAADPSADASSDVDGLRAG